MICSLLKSKLERLLKFVQICLILLILINVSILEVYAAQYPGQIGNGGLDITLTPNATGYGQMYIEWKSQGYNYFDKYFRVFRRSEGGEYETVQIDYTQVTSVRCLQIYPTGAAANQMKSWVVNTGYGKGIIQVDSVSIDQFNGNPQGYLQDSQGNWKYDVLFFGTWDSNNEKDLSNNSLNWTRKFIEAGRGVIFGHDTIRQSWNQRFNSLAQYAGIEIQNIGFERHNQVIIVKTGLFTTYPNYIGTTGTVLNIPTAHNVGQVVTTGTSWLKFYNGKYGNDNQYLTTYNNCAMIQTGHSSGQATQDEQKILQNLIFYCNQLIFSQYYTNDYQAQDYAKPNKPQVNRDSNRIYVANATDNGSTYYYYVESYGKNNVDLNDVLDRSPERSHTVITGVKEYIYVWDNNPNTVVSSKTQSGVKTSSDGNIPEDRNCEYLHVAAIDGAGNIGPTETVRAMFTVTYNQNNGKNEQQLDNVLASQRTYTVKNNMFKYDDDHRFLSWNTSADGQGQTYFENQTISIDDDIELYAQWTNVYYLIIDPNDGLWVDDFDVVPYYNYGDLQKISLKATHEEYTDKAYFRLQILDKKKIADPTRFGYNFLGWKFEQQ